MSKLFTYQLPTALIKGVRIVQWVQLTARLVNRVDLSSWTIPRRILASLRRRQHIYVVYGWFWYTGLDEPVPYLVLYEVQRPLPFLDWYVYLRETP